VSARANRILNTDGRASTRVLFLVVFFVLPLYAGAKLVPPFFSYQMLKMEVVDEAKSAHMYNDAVLKKRILQKASSWSVPVGRRDIRIRRTSRHINIKINYTVSVSFFDRYTKVFKFRIETRKPLKEGSGILN